MVFKHVPMGKHIPTKMVFPINSYGFPSQFQFAVFYTLFPSEPVLEQNRCAPFCFEV
jgi:hypothetical protein